MRVLWQSGIRTIIFRDEYKDFKEQLDMKDLNIKLSKIDNYTKIELTTKE